MDATAEEVDYDCPICQEIFKMPIRTKNCHHVFCKGCFQMAVRSQGLHCPLCRGPVSEKEKLAADIREKLRKTRGRCRACGDETFLSKMRQHYKSCWKYKEEYGPVPTVTPPAPVRPPARPVHREIIPNIPLFTLTNSEERMYSCPYCPLVGLRDMTLVQHCVSQHRGECTAAVCPICVHLPWGDPQYRSHNLIGHMMRRHRFSYTRFMNEEDDEAFQVCQALQMSFQEF